MAKENNRKRKKGPMNDPSKPDGIRGKKIPKGGKLTDRFENAIAGASGRAKKKRTK